MGQLLKALFTTDWPEAAMRGHSMALSGLLAALLVMVVRGQDYSGTMQCQCECASDCTSGDSVTCDCPEPLCLRPWIYTSMSSRCWCLPNWNVTKVPWRWGSSNDHHNDNNNATATSTC